MSDIFLSYRRDDEAGYVGRIADSLRFVFGDVVFRDVDSILGGSKWKLELRKQVSRARVLVAVIGPNWQSILAERDSESDYVRYELNLAHKLEIPVIPVKIEGAPFDYDRDLGDLSWLFDLQSMGLSDRQGRWATDLKQLVRCIVDSTDLDRIDRSDKQNPKSHGNAIRQQTSAGNQSPNIQAESGDVTISYGGSSDNE